MIIFQQPSVGGLRRSPNGAWGHPPELSHWHSFLVKGTWRSAKKKKNVLQKYEDHDRLPLFCDFHVCVCVFRCSLGEFFINMLQLVPFLHGFFQCVFLWQKYRGFVWKLSGPRLRQADAGSWGVAPNVGPVVRCPGVPLESQWLLGERKR